MEVEGKEASKVRRPQSSRVPQKKALPFSTQVLPRRHSRRVRRRALCRSRPGTANSSSLRGFLLSVLQPSLPDVPPVSDVCVCVCVSLKSLSLCVYLFLPTHPHSLSPSLALLRFLSPLPLSSAALRDTVDDEEANLGLASSRSSLHKLAMGNYKVLLCCLTAHCARQPPLPFCGRRSKAPISRSLFCFCEGAAWGM